jgi:signal transduction histidine kinase
VRSGGLGPALRSLARRATIAVELDVAAITRLPEPVEVAAYYVVSEALTNATRHAHASVVEVDAEASGGTLRVRVRDDGVGGVDPVRGSGLVAVSRRWVARSPCRARWAAARRCPASFRS